MEQLLELVKRAQLVTLTTHRDCDGDGVGAMLAFFHALRKLNVKAQVVTVDEIPNKYSFLPGFSEVKVFSPQQPLPQSDLLIAFDTNDSRRIEPLGSWAQKLGPVLYIDHHPVLEKGPHPGHSSYINTLAASTGEMTFDLIQSLKIELDSKISQCLYTSLVFDTQLFRFIRKSPRSHEIAAELMHHSFDPTEIHRHLFGNQSPEKLKFLARALSEIEYLHHGKVAFLTLSYLDFQKYNVDPEASRDVVDMMMNVRDVEISALFRQETENKMKVSLRSKGRFEVLSLAEKWGGGGHLFAAGSSVQFQNIDQLKKDLIAWLKSQAI